MPSGCRTSSSRGPSHARPDSCTCSLRHTIAKVGRPNKDWGGVWEFYELGGYYEGAVMIVILILEYSTQNMASHGQTLDPA